ncbi:MAG: PTS sugar transporter subunit IIA [Lachnospiraceae bacterium]|jgi:PTS system mannose-specific IIA component|nr:PTS sugar transporter subunit IIA [Lachnospiraceae bacterium]
MKVILLSHGTLAQGMAEACRMILGDTSRLLTLSLEEEAGVAAFEDELRQLLQEIEGPYMILCDLYFGTPFNMAARLAQEDLLNGRCRILTGVNLAMLLEVMTGLEEEDMTDLDKLARAAMAACREGFHDYIIKEIVDNYDEDECL